MNQTQTSESDEPYERLRALIVNGSLRPGEALSERSLAERLQVGRTPIREAVKWLARDGLLEIVPMRGTFVREMSVGDLREIHEMRIALEGMAAFLAARRGSCASLDDTAARLEALAEGIAAEQALDVDEAQSIGWAFHEAMFECADNQRLRQAYQNLRAQSGLALRRVERYSVERTREAVLEHLEICTAIKAGDGEQARRLVYAHLERALQIRLKFLAHLGEERT
ncbi:MAG: GntR family transcriptional regulator [Paraburkholderia sp.]|jgi:DNA-binding GntR family transcriptional regulator|uniref:GntR family transcriptional regulator n=1 Tax=Burkholderiaceae TaxID=119060 RepID=UPI0010F9F235|nr:GntR family transcriptional regulator [Burkholderia sp. 4M9327F10]